MPTRESSIQPRSAAPDLPPSNRADGAVIAAIPAIAEVTDHGQRLGRQQLAWLQGRLTAAMGAAGAVGEVRVRVVGDSEMAAAHLHYARIPGTTDVLTFDLSDRSSGGLNSQDGVDAEDGLGAECGLDAESGLGAERVLDVDILVCFDEGARQAVGRGHSVERELLLYAVHGLLHCLGEDDHDPVSAARMHAREDRTLATIGVAPTYSVPELTGGVPEVKGGAPVLSGVASELTDGTAELTGTRPGRNTDTE